MALAPAAEFGIQGSQFTLDGKPAFLAGASYYGGLGASEETLRRDLDDLKGAGFSWIRVWATWAAFGEDVSAVDLETGEPREPYLARLRALLGECDRRGIAVNVTLSRGNGTTGPSKIQDLKTHRRAVETLVTSLRDRRNWWLDLSNERNIRDKRFTSLEDLAALRSRARELDSRRLVTASHVGDPTRGELRAYLETAGLDFISVHRDRSESSPAQTEVQARECRTLLKELKREVPLLYDEPFRRGYGSWAPRAEDFAADMKGALAGGAAGWCFHNGSTRGTPDEKPRRSFDLREMRLFESLDAEERKAIDAIHKILDGTGPTAPASR